MPRRLPAIMGQVGMLSPNFKKTSWVFPKNRGVSPKMDGENNGKAYFLMDDLGENPLFSETSSCFLGDGLRRMMEITINQQDSYRWGFLEFEHPKS